MAAGLAARSRSRGVAGPDPGGSGPRRHRGARGGRCGRRPGDGADADGGPLTGGRIGQTAARGAGIVGGRWTTQSAETQFGASAPPGELSGPGSARWRQRAFFDFVKDLAPLACGLPMARIAIWDRVAFGSVSMTLGHALDEVAAAPAIARLIESRRPLETTGPAVPS